MPDSTLDRFLTKFVVADNGCWVWTAGRTRNGYGQFSVGLRNYRAHRWAYEHWVGPIPEGLQLDHLCRVRHCVNPDHLEPVTARENFLRGDNRSAIAHRTGRCHKGHRFTPDNMLASRLERGERVCLQCKRESRSKGMRKSHARKA